MAELRKQHVLAVHTVAVDGSSTQPDDQGDPWTPEGALAPPADLEALAGLTKQTRLRRSCIAAIVLNTVGLGFTMRVRDGHQEDIADIEADTRNAIARLNALSKRDRRLKRPTFGRQLRAVAWDRQEVGNGYLEVSRNQTTGEIDGLFHAPGKRVRRKKDGGWLVLPSAGASLTQAVQYYDFGEKVVYDENGQPTPLLADGASRWKVNELIPFQLYTSESRDYGLPPDAQLAGDYLGDKLAGDTNVSFFDSKGVPPTAIFVQGEEVEEGEVVKIEVPEAYIKQIIDTLRSSGPGARRVAVIGVPSGFKAQVENLAVTSDRDLGYINFRSDNRRAVLAAWRLSPVFVADIEDAGRYTAEVERQLTKEQVFDPEQEEVTELLDPLIAELFPALTIKFDEMRVAGDEVQRQSANDLADRGRIRNGEYREALGWPPLPEAKQGETPGPGQVPFGWNNELVEPGLRVHGGGVGATGTGTDPSATPGAITKRSERSVEARLASDLDADFEAHVEEAIRMIHEQTGRTTEPVIVEKDGDRIVISPYSTNGGSG